MARAQDTTRVPTACAGQPIEAITVYSAAPTVSGARRILGQVARAVHVTTHTEVILNLLLLRVGDLCHELRRGESERILRAQPFLADATVEAYDGEHGGVVLEVRTVDETSLILGARLTGNWPFFRAWRVGNSNYAGRGLLVAAEWRDGGAYRDWMGGRISDRQLFGRPWVMTVETRQRPLGYDWLVETEHAFLTDIQRIAWRIRAGAIADYVVFEPRPEEMHGVRLARNFFDVGGIVRVGPPGRLSLFGASLTNSIERPGTVPVLITREGLREDTSTVLRDRWSPHHHARGNALWGVRDIRFARVEGFDALTAAQDVPIGFQLGTLIGRSLTVLGAKEDDLLMAADLYIGAGGERGMFRLQLQGEARRDNDAARWDGLLASGRTAQYFKLNDRDLLILSGEWSGGRRQRVPFLLTLGAREGGLRGFRKAREPGARRGVARAEFRHVVGRVLGYGDLGWSAFADAGRLWRGDVPYGVTTPVQASIGMGLLAAVPPRSARLWRLDLAVPVTSGHGRRVELRLSSADRTAFFWRDPPDVEGTRDRTVPSTLFGWP